MAKAPAVRDLQKLIKTYSASFDPQRQLIDSDIEANANAGVAQERGLAAKQTKAFGDIEQAASNKGMFFSGFSPDAQANYTSDTYLPALANLQAAIASTRSNLLGKKADLDTSARTSALGAQENDRSALNAWQSAEADRAFQAKQAEIKRRFDATEAEKARRAAAAESAASRAASTSASGPKYTWKKNKSDGYDVFDASGKRASVDLATAVASQGGGLTNLVSLLNSGSASDRRAAQEYLKTGEYSTLVKGTGAFYTGGGF